MYDETITLDNSFMETCGSNTLSGLLLKQYHDRTGHFPSDHPATLTLRIPQTSYSYRDQTNGPDIWIMPEYAIHCLLENILSLQARGVKIVIETFIQDP
ncbi:MAG: hypothetical protein MN733_40845 [Nitrososphaera sp.]|nr:hypothetical protein [Nitrososphaera sp.]